MKEDIANRREEKHFSMQSCEHELTVIKQDQESAKRKDASSPDTLFRGRDEREVNLNTSHQRTGPQQPRHRRGRGSSISAIPVEGGNDDTMMAGLTREDLSARHEDLPKNRQNITLQKSPEPSVLPTHGICTPVHKHDELNEEESKEITMVINQLGHPEKSEFHISQEEIDPLSPHPNQSNLHQAKTVPLKAQESQEDTAGGSKNCEDLPIRSKKTEISYRRVASGKRKSGNEVSRTTNESVVTVEVPANGRSSDTVENENIILSTYKEHVRRARSFKKGAETSEQHSSIVAPSDENSLKINSPPERLGQNEGGNQRGNSKKTHSRAMRPVEDHIPSMKQTRRSTTTT